MNVFNHNCMEILSTSQNPKYFLSPTGFIIVVIIIIMKIITIIIITFRGLFKNSIYILISMDIAFGYYDWRERVPLISKEVLLGSHYWVLIIFGTHKFSSSPPTIRITTPSLTKTNFTTRLLKIKKRKKTY